MILIQLKQWICINTATSDDVILPNYMPPHIYSYTENPTGRSNYITGTH